MQTPAAPSWLSILALPARLLTQAWIAWLSTLAWLLILAQRAWNLTLAGQGAWLVTPAAPAWLSILALTLAPILKLGDHGAWPAAHAWLSTLAVPHHLSCHLKIKMLLHQLAGSSEVLLKVLVKAHGLNLHRVPCLCRDEDPIRIPAPELCKIYISHVHLSPEIRVEGIITRYYVPLET